MSRGKKLAGHFVASLNRQCDFERACFLIGHMRCGSTALSAILVSGGDLSGYGEAHIRYDSHAALGLLAINQWRRGAWNRQARGLFDKILHNRYDAGAPKKFFTSRAVFMARAPLPAIASIRQLFATLASDEYSSDEAAARYYCERLDAMLELFPRFADNRRVALTYEALVAQPETMLASVSRQLGIKPPLINRYTVKAASQARGGGDPINAARFDRIVALPVHRLAVKLAIEPETLAQAQLLHQRFCRLCEDTESVRPARSHATTATYSGETGLAPTS